MIIQTHHPGRLLKLDSRTEAAAATAAQLDDASNLAAALAGVDPADIINKKSFAEFIANRKRNKENTPSPPKKSPGRKVSTNTRPSVSFKLTVKDGPTLKSLWLNDENPKAVDFKVSEMKPK